MNLKALRLAADFAAHRQHLRYDQLVRAWRPLQNRLRPTDNPGSMLAASFASGAVIARVPASILWGSVSTMLGTASFFLRSPVSSLVVAAIATARSKHH